MPSDDILGKLQNLPAQYHWALSDYNLLFAIYGNKPVARTGKILLLAILVKLSQRIGIVWLFVYLIGMVELIKLLVKQHVSMKNKRRNGGEYPAFFFVGFGVAKENELCSFYGKDKVGVVEKLHQYKVETFASWHRVDVVSGFRSLFYDIVLARNAVAALPFELVCRRVDFLTYIASKIGYYSYMRSWFSILTIRKSSNLKEVAFSCQNLAAFAAVDVGVPSTYLSHGMLTRCELLPAFGAVTALTVDEAAFAQHRLPNAHVNVYEPPRRRLIPSQLVKEVLITSCPIGGNKKYMLSVIPFLRWAEKRNVPVRVRLHPSEDPTFFWSDFVNEGLVTIENSDADFFQAIDRLKPRLLISWVSTTLSDVITCGVIPITACQDDDMHVAELVYPIFRRCLRLTNDFESIERLFDDDEYYESVLSRLCVE